jgi:hypothetical protein
VAVVQPLAPVPEPCAAPSISRCRVIAFFAFPSHLSGSPHGATNALPHAQKSSVHSLHPAQSGCCAMQCSRKGLQGAHERQQVVQPTHMRCKSAGCHAHFVPRALTAFERCAVHERWPSMRLAAPERRLQWQGCGPAGCAFTMPAPSKAHICKPKSLQQKPTTCSTSGHPGHLALHGGLSPWRPAGMG